MGTYAYHPTLPQPLVAALFVGVLALLIWRRRAVPGAKGLALAGLFSVLFLLGTAGELAAVGPSAKLAWFTFRSLWLLPAVTSTTWFVLEYVRPRGWSNRLLPLLAMPPVLLAVLILTNDRHHWIYRIVEVTESVQIGYTLPGLILVGYGVALILITVPVFLWLFMRSPQHRWPAALMIVGQLLSRGLYLIDTRYPLAGGAIDLTTLSNLAPFTIYAVAFFAFRIFDPLPAAQRTAMEQMREGMIVCDPDWRVASVNAEAGAILGLQPGSVRGKTLAEVLPAFPEPAVLASASRDDPLEIRQGSGPEAREYVVGCSPLVDFRGLAIGWLLLIHDVTEHRQAQALVMRQQWAQATQQEREQLAYELHDNLSQDLAFLNMQAQASQLYLRAGQSGAALESLSRLSQVARHMQGNTRRLIDDLLAVGAPAEGCLQALRQVVDRFRDGTGLAVELVLADGASDGCGPALLSPEAALQVIRIVQEALANVAKHAGQPARVEVQIGLAGGELEVTVHDNGAGFAADQSTDESHHGLQAMRYRAARVGGEVAVTSTPGKGTSVCLRVPLPPSAGQNGDGAG